MSLQFTNVGGKETFVKCKIVKLKADFSSKTVKWGEKILKSTFFIDFKLKTINLVMLYCVFLQVITS